MAKKNQHVVPDAKGWRIVGDKTSQTFKTQKEAIEAARTIAKNQNAELIIHGRDGKIRSRISYGNDPHPPHDKPKKSKQKIIKRGGIAKKAAGYGKTGSSANKGVAKKASSGPVKSKKRKGGNHGGAKKSA